MRRTSPARTSSVRRSWGPASSERALRPFEVFCPVSRNKTYRRGGGCRAPPVFRNPLLKEGIAKKGSQFQKGLPPPLSLRNPFAWGLPGGPGPRRGRRSPGGRGGGEGRPRPPAVKARPRSFDQRGPPGGPPVKARSTRAEVQTEPRSPQHSQSTSPSTQTHCVCDRARGMARGSGGLPAPPGRGAPSSALQPRCMADLSQQ